MIILNANPPLSCLVTIPLCDEMFIPPFFAAYLAIPPSSVEDRTQSNQGRILKGGAAPMFFEVFSFFLPDYPGLRSNANSCKVSSVLIL